MYKVKVNNSVFEITSVDGTLHLNGEPYDWDIARINERSYHIIKDNRSYRAEIISIDSGKKTMVIKINGDKYDIKLQDKFDLLLERLGMDAAAANKISEIKAPMPGLIVDVNVATGDEVRKGDAIIVLEAMKMENVIRAEGEGLVKSVKVKKGESVEKNQVLVQF